MGKYIPPKVRKSHEITKHGIKGGWSHELPKIKRGQIDPFGSSSVKADLVLCYKLLHGLTIVSDINKFFTIDVGTQTRGHNWRLRADKPRLDSRLHFYAYRTARVWNSLSFDTVNAESVRVFINSLS